MAWGIAAGHHHVDGHWVPAPEAGVRAALAAMGATVAVPPATRTWVIRRDDGLRLPAAAVLRTEDGGSVRVSGLVAPEAVPYGYHWLDLDGQEEPVRLIVSPGSCPLPPRTWGWAVQLYAARSRSSWGMGDLADLRRLAEWSGRELGAGMLLVNPLHAVAPTPGQQASPYFPSSRRWRNPIYLRVEEVAGANAADLTAVAAEGRSLNTSSRIKRDDVWRLKRGALQRIWDRRGAGDDVDFDAWAAERGAALDDFGTWCALADTFGPDWRAWPTEYRRHDAPAVRAFGVERRDMVRFHSWLQWLVERQLAKAAAAGPAIVTDVAIGGDPAGADAWQWQDHLAAGVTVGAPPDEFSPDGQDWGLPPFDPWRLRAVGYEPFVQILRAAMAGGGGVRVDHVAGLFRLFWVPVGAGPSSGVYVNYPWQDLLNVVALEAYRSGAFVVGEDLGTVEPQAREALAASGILSYRLLWFEERPPSEWPELALAAVTTHDLPTVAGVWTGADLRARRTVGLPVDEEAEQGLRSKLVGGVDAGQAVRDVVLRAYEALAAAPSRLVAATLEDALEVEERPNQPGTVEEWPNWCIALPLSLEDVERDPRVRAVADVVREGRV